MLMFLIQVWKMRLHQNAWFRLHKQSDLYEAKRYEKLVDDGLKRYLFFSDQGEPVALMPSGLDDGAVVRPTTARQENLFTEADDGKEKN